MGFFFFCKWAYSCNFSRKQKKSKENHPRIFYCELCELIYLKNKISKSNRGKWRQNTIQKILPALSLSPLKTFQRTLTCRSPSFWPAGGRPRSTGGGVSCHRNATPPRLRDALPIDTYSSSSLLSAIGRMKSKKRDIYLTVTCRMWNGEKLITDPLS